jgi:hypothetical protein
MPLYNRYYLHARGATRGDPTIVWGTDVEWEELQNYLRRLNEGARVLLSPVHVLLKATAHAVVQHPRFNCRVVGRRVYAYHEINLRLAFRDRRHGDVRVVLLRRANELSLVDIAQSVWSVAIEHASGNWAGDRDCRRLQRLPTIVFHWVWRLYSWLDTRFPLPALGRLDGLRSGAVFVNDLSFQGAPPMRCYKPSRFPDESTTVSVTLGPVEHKALVRNGVVTAGRVAPLIVRADHRLVDSCQLAQFVATLREVLQHPAALDRRQSGAHGPNDISSTQARRFVEREPGEAA